jgi:hypothetical protein
MPESPSSASPLENNTKPPSSLIHRIVGTVVLKVCSASSFPFWGSNSRPAYLASPRQSHFTMQSSAMYRPSGDADLLQWLP